MALTELAEKGADIDVLGRMVQFMAQRLMELDVEVAAAPAATRRAPGINSRNGYRERTRDTRAGSVALKPPKLRTGIQRSLNAELPMMSP